MRGTAPLLLFMLRIAQFNVLWITNKYFIIIDDDDGGMIEVGFLNYGMDLSFSMVYKPGYVSEHTTEEGDALTAVPDHDITLCAKLVTLTYLMIFVYEKLNCNLLVCSIIRIYY